jgi:hypothetical protein
VARQSRWVGALGVVWGDAVTDTLSTEYLLGMLSEAASARGWVLELSYSADGCWRAAVVDYRGGGELVVECDGVTAKEALAGLWVAVARHCRWLATRGPG